MPYPLDTLSRHHHLIVKDFIQDCGLVLWSIGVDVRGKSRIKSGADGRREPQTDHLNSAPLFHFFEIPYRLIVRGSPDHGSCNHVFHFLQRTNLNDIAGGFGLEDRFLSRKRIDTLSGLGGRFPLYFDLQEPGQGELTGASLLDMTFDEAFQSVKNR